MELALQILFGIVAAICLAAGANLFIKGAAYFLPETTAPQPRLDNTFRFLSGMFFAFGFMLIWFICNIKTTTDVIYFIGFVVVCAGLGRLYSSIKMGSAGKHQDRIMWIEIGIGMALILLQYFR